VARKVRLVDEHLSASEECWLAVPEVLVRIADVVHLELGWRYLAAGVQELKWHTDGLCSIHDREPDAPPTISAPVKHATWHELHVAALVLGAAFLCGAASQVSSIRIQRALHVAAAPL
jgi:hypothetical protein